MPVAAPREELLPVSLAAVILGSFALLVCYVRGYILLYGDAVAHLGIARRILDSRNPGLVQLGGVWLPLPHLLMVPFVQNISWWHNGLAGAWPSLACYVLSVVGLYRLTRRLLAPRLATVATAFYALNPNLLYVSTTALNEPLSLALLIWTTLLVLECSLALRGAVEPTREGLAAPPTVEDRARRVRRLLIGTGVLTFLAVMTRYDGWIVGAVAWCVLAWEVARQPDLRRRVAPAFAVFTLLAIAGPVLWLAYNQHFAHDWLDFMRGPYSAAAIERKTSPPHSRHYRGWHNPGWALLFYTRTAQVDASFWETGFLLLAAALLGLWFLWRQRVGRAALLLWVPLPFYVYSVAYGSVPIFIPQLYPHSFYNSRYGLEMLPALAVFPLFVAQRYARSGMHPVFERLFSPLALALIVLNTIGMMDQVPLVLKEGMVNARTRVALETAIATQIESFPPGVPILMYTSAHIGALQQAEIPLKRVVNESDYDSWVRALKDPAKSAAYVVAIAGDPVSEAVARHPEGLTELTVLCTTGQPCARIYRSDQFTAH